MKNGPRQPLSSYLPKRLSNREKLVRFLTPQSQIPIPLDPKAAVAAPSANGAQDDGDDNDKAVFKVKEKRLDPELWRIDGESYKGSHFPIAAFTNQVGRRSPEKHQKRQNRQWAKYGWGSNGWTSWGSSSAWA